MQDRFIAAKEFAFENAIQLGIDRFSATQRSGPLLNNRKPEHGSLPKCLSAYHVTSSRPVA